MANTFQAVGRRKEAIARVRLVPGTGQKTINGKSIDEFFPRKTLITDIVRPLEVTSTGDRYDIVRERERWWGDGPGRCREAGDRSRARQGGRELPQGSEAGWTADQRLADEGTEEARAARRSQEVPVLEEVAAAYASVRPASS